MTSKYDLPKNPDLSYYIYWTTITGESPPTVRANVQVFEEMDKACSFYLQMFRLWNEGKTYRGGKIIDVQGNLIPKTHADLATLIQKT